MRGKAVLCLYIYLNHLFLLSSFSSAKLITVLSSREDPMLCIMYLYVSYATVNEGEHFESFESVEDSHVSKILEYEFDDLYFIHLFPDIVLESIHSFLDS